jgi:hypothetical protein
VIDTYKSETFSVHSLQSEQTISEGGSNNFLNKLLAENKNNKDSFRKKRNMSISVSVKSGE